MIWNPKQGQRAGTSKKGSTILCLFYFYAFNTTRHKMEFKENKSNIFTSYALFQRMLQKPPLLLLIFSTT